MIREEEARNDGQLGMNFCKEEMFTGVVVCRMTSEDIRCSRPILLYQSTCLTPSIFAVGLFDTEDDAMS
jgi:hypothetical protein